jgi:hypothetical protein
LRRRNEVMEAIRRRNNRAATRIQCAARGFALRCVGGVGVVGGGCNNERGVVGVVGCGGGVSDWVCLCCSFFSVLLFFFSLSSFLCLLFSALLSEHN